MSQCIFCKIAKGEIPSATLYEDEDFRAILDVNPASKGHTLLLPKHHYKDMYEMPEELLEKAMKRSKNIAQALKCTLHCDGLNVLQNNGAAAGQTVFHYHVHLIPRYQEDLVSLTWEPENITEEEALWLVKEIKGTNAWRGCHEGIKF